MTATKTSNTVLTMLGSQQPPFVPEGVEAMTVRLDLPPGDPGSPPHRHSGPVFGYMLEGEPERVVRAGEAFWEPAGTSSTTRPPTTWPDRSTSSWW